MISLHNRFYTNKDEFLMILLGTVIVFLLTSIGLYFFIRYAFVLGMVDKPNARSMHTRIVPRGGGLVFVSIALTAALIFSWVQGVLDLKRALIYLAIAIVLWAGFVDDKKEVSPKIKFIYIFIAAAIACYSSICLTYLGSYLGHPVYLPIWLAAPFTFFAIAGFTNALNLMDGLDGLAGGLSVIMLGAFLWIGLNFHDDFMIITSAIFLAAILAFLLYNWHPAKVFMGDSGSLTLGFVIALLAIRAGTHVSPSSVLFILVLPIMDTFIVMTRRIQRGLSPFHADKTHMHHLLFNRYRDVSYTTIILLYIQLAFTLIGLQLTKTDDFLSIILMGILFFIFLKLFDQRSVRRKPLKERAPHIRFIEKLRDDYLNPLQKQPAIYEELYGAAQKRADTLLTPEKKIEIVMDIIRGKKGIDESAEEFDISVEIIEMWVKDARTGIDQALRK